MKWNNDNIKFKHNKDGASSRKAKIIDAVATTPAAIVAGGTGGALSGGLIADTLNFGPTKPATKSTQKLINKAIKHHKLSPDVKMFTGQAAVKQGIKDKSLGKGYATVSYNSQKFKDAEKALKKNPKNKVQLGKLWRSAIKNPRIVVPSANEHVLLHELGHIKQFHSMPRMVTNTTLTKVVKPGSAAAAVALMSHEDTAKYAPIAGAAMSAGELSMEGGASIFAAKEMKRQRGWKAGLQTALKMVKPFATYVAKPAGVALGLYGLKNYLHGSGKKSGK